ncbi:MAG: DUF1127 domain-containing protein [Kiloniellales bacterium]
MSTVYSQTGKTLISRGPRPRGDFLGLIARAPGALFEIVMLWQQRAIERHHLAGLSEHHLKDIGFSRADVEREFSKPFWRG